MTGTALIQPDPSLILERLSIGTPLIGLYDAPNPEPFEPLVQPGARQCVFASLKQWRQGKTLHLTRERHGCGAPYLLGVAGRPREEMVSFLCDEEGLRASHALMDLWLDAVRHYEPRNDHILIGPLRPGQYDSLRTVTFYVNPDQLSVLCSGAAYFAKPTDAPSVVVPFGSGCMQLASLFDDLEVPQAMIGGTDQAMRKHLEPWMLAFTTTRPMFELLCRWAADPKSSLHTGFLVGLIKARGGSLSTLVGTRRRA
jgi:hypothetical protein